MVLILQDSEESYQKGVGYLRQAAETGHRAAMIELARLLDQEGEGNTHKYNTSESLIATL